MEFRSYQGCCLCSLGGDFPAGSESVGAPFAPLVLLVKRDPQTSRGWFAITDIDEAFAPEGVCNLQPAAPSDAAPQLRAFVERHGAAVLNTAFSNAFSVLLAHQKKTAPLRVVLVGLGDVGGIALTALKLLGREFSELRIYDPNEALCARYEIELNQVLSVDGGPLPAVQIARPDTLFDCDLFLFAASRGVPALDAQVRDVRMAQYTRNREMLRAYARQARAARFSGLFCQISDPVDQLARAVFLDSNRSETGAFDADGLLPEQVLGFGLGVMAARAAYYAQKARIAFEDGCVYGPHGSDLIVANSLTHYDDALSRSLAQAASTANLRVRDLGFKPYLAPALSSAAASILRLLRGEVCNCAVPLGGASFGCQCRMTPQGLLIERRTLPYQLAARIATVYRRLEEFSYD